MDSEDRPSIVAVEAPFAQVKATGGAKPTEIVALVLGFAALAAASVLPWFSIKSSASSLTGLSISSIDSVGSLHLIDALGLLSLQIPFYFGVTVLLLLCASVVFGSATTRRVCAPLALTTVAVVALMVLTVLADKGTTYDERLLISTHLRVTYRPGAYAGIVALLLLAAAVAPAMRQHRPLPARTDLRRSLARMAVRPADRDAELTEADLLRPSGAYERTVVTAAGAPDPAVPIEAPPAIDHSIYQRPQMPSHNGHA